jgi:hypothetical protein
MRAKMPESPLEFWVWPIVIAIVCIGACVLSRKSYWIAGPFALFLLYQGWTNLYANVSFSGNVLSEFGLGYWLVFAGAYALPIFSISVYALYDFRRGNRRKKWLAAYFDD